MTPNPAADPPNLFSDYSFRALRVIFIARLKAGNAGATAIDIDHLVAGIVVEDGGKNAMAKLLNVDPNSIGVMADMEPHPVPFFPSEVAAMLLAKIEELSPHSEPIPKSRDMPMSSEFTQVLNAAQDLRRQFQSAKVYPLHLLAAALGDPSSKASQVLRDAGISQEKVLEALQKD